MTRKILTVAILSTLFATAAQAKDRSDIKAKKQQFKAAKQLSKQTKKLEKKLDRFVDKDKLDRAQEVRGELRAIYKDELARLRRRGMPTVAETLTHPAHKDNPDATVRVDTGAPQMEALRDLVVSLKNANPDTKGEARKLEALTLELEQRVDRKKAQLKAARKA